MNKQIISRIKILEQFNKTDLEGINIVKRIKELAACAQSQQIFKTRSLQHSN